MEGSKATIPDSIWDIGNPMIPMHDGTVDYEYIKYEPVDDVSNRTDYRLWSTDVDAFLIPETAFLEVQFRLTQSDNTTPTWAENERPALCGNGFYLFEDARFSVQDVEIAHVQKPGRVAHVHNLIHADREYIETVGENAHYYLEDVSDEHSASLMNGNLDAVLDATLEDCVGPAGPYTEVLYNFTTGSTVASTAVSLNQNFDRSFKRRVDRQKAITTIDSTGSQTVRLPLRDIFPCLSTNRVVKGSRMEFNFNKINTVKEALYGDNGSDETKLVIKRVALWIARVRPSVSILKELMSTLKDTPKIEHVYENMKLYHYPYSDFSSGDKVYQVVHRQNKPTKVAVWFQFNSRYNDEKLNPLKFDLLGAGDRSAITRMELKHNSKPVPLTVYNPKADHTRILDEIYRVSNIDKENSHCITYKNWRSNYPLFVFDVSQLEGTAYESRTQSVLDLAWTLDSATDGNGLYTVNVLVYSEMKAVYNYSDGITTIRTQ